MGDRRRVGFRPGGARTRVPVLLQDSIAECGAAALAMLVCAHGHHVTVPEVRDRLGIGRDGSNAAALAAVAEEYGMTVEAYQAESWALKQLRLPALLHWNLNHYVVLEEFSEHHATIVDPSQGRQKVSREEFDSSFSGVVLTLTPGPEFQAKARPRGEVLGFLAQYAPRRPSLIAGLLGVSALLTALGLLPALITQHILDDVIAGNSPRAMHTIGLGIAALVVGQALIGFTRNQLLLHLRNRIDHTLMTSFLRHLFRLPYPYFQLRNSGDILTRVSSSMLVREVLTSHTLSLVLDGGMGLLYIVILWQVAPAIALVVLGAAVCQIAVALAFTPRVRDASRQEIGEMTLAQAQLVESLSGIETLKAAGAERVALDRWQELYERQLAATRRKGTVSNTMDGVMDLTRLGAPLALLWTGAWLVMDGHMSIGTLVGANTLAGMALGPISTLSRTYHALQGVGVHVRRLRDVLAEPPEQPEPRPRIPVVRGDIRLESVRYQYQPDAPPAVDAVNLHVPAGSSVAVVGRSGSGKSTLARLMLGLYQPVEGRVLLDGAPIDRFDVESVRSRFGVVVQDNAVFSGTILDNIRINRPDVSPDDVVEAAGIACLQADIERMPMGYFTALGERGSGMSGGQRQRIGLARALVGRPSVLLMDEATSHLDTLTEETIQQNLRELRCTRVVIAHRLSTVRSADLIVVVDQGRIVEQGTHEELIAADGAYAQLVQSRKATSSVSLD
ncbi:peptidase domain-containing ABC transporter [Streptomyces longispororuber]|uniref:peptidase domain-containing ABC transporter n=1 Tax=Streptomyces longispororuber TaxID=68230 RepID=UPI002109B86F|nr:peptidase domain-containing ABC transporter [Streptomyces longispororuber]MCQ4208728.1 peptidase domain-containing ABC transporter [Streptomyces longispororuber]